MFWGRNKSKNSECYKTLEAQEVTGAFILINLQDNSKMSCLICLNS